MQDTMDTVLGKGPLLGTCEKYYIYKRNTETTALGRKKNHISNGLFDLIARRERQDETNYNSKKQARPHGFKTAWLTGEPRWKQTKMKANNT
jgi:hypothetical protein